MNVLIACPAKLARMQYQTADAIAKIQKWIRMDGHACAYFLKPFTDLIDGRNSVATYAHLAEIDLLIGIDDDIGVNREAFDRMIGAEADFVGARIPSREVDLDRFAEAIRQGMPNAQAERFAISPDGADSDGDGISEVDRVGCAFFMIRRPVLAAIVEKGLASRKVAATPQGAVEMLGFYDPLPGADGTQMSPEDSFCSRVREAGFGVSAYSGPGVSFTAKVAFGT